MSNPTVELRLKIPQRAFRYLRAVADLLGVTPEQYAIRAIQSGLDLDVHEPVEDLIRIGPSVGGRGWPPYEKPMKQKEPENLQPADKPDPHVVPFRKQRTGGAS